MLILFWLNGVCSRTFMRFIFIRGKAIVTNSVLEGMIGDGIDFDNSLRRNALFVIVPYVILLFLMLMA